LASAVVLGGGVFIAQAHKALSSPPRFAGNPIHPGSYGVGGLDVTEELLSIRREIFKKWGNDLNPRQRQALHDDFYSLQDTASNWDIGNWQRRRWE
jgi:hypothetical protein